MGLAEREGGPFDEDAPIEIYEVREMESNDVLVMVRFPCMRPALPSEEWFVLQAQGEHAFTKAMDIPIVNDPQR